EKGKKTVDGFWRRGDETAVPAQHFRRVFKRPKHGSRIDGVERMCSKLKRRHDTEISAATTHGPEQIGVFLSVGLHEPPVGQHHLHLQQTIYGQAPLTR